MQVTARTTKANSTLVLGTMSATDFINIGSRVPNYIKKRRFGHETEAYSTGTVTMHYLSF